MTSPSSRRTTASSAGGADDEDNNGADDAPHQPRAPTPPIPFDGSLVASQIGSHPLTGLDWKQMILDGRQQLASVRVRRGALLRGAGNDSIMGGQGRDYYGPLMYGGESTPTFAIWI